MTSPSRLSVVLHPLPLLLLAACASAPLKPPATIEIAPASAPAAEAAPAPLPTAAQHPAAKPASNRPTTLPGTTIRFEGGDGSTKESAIIVLGAKGEQDGVDSEYQYLDLLYGPRPTGWTMIQQSLLGDMGQNYDALEIERSGKRQAVYFDITDYFGKF
jgi:hypothetical protein